MQALDIRGSTIINNKRGKLKWLELNSESE
jgi:hypothetical protein